MLKIMEMIEDHLSKEGNQAADVSGLISNFTNSLTLEELSCGLTHFCFRNDPVEDIHADGKLSEIDMKVLNKFVHNKLFTFLTLLNNNEIQRMLPHLAFFTNVDGWDKPEFQLYD